MKINPWPLVILILSGSASAKDPICKVTDASKYPVVDLPMKKEKTFMGNTRFSLIHDELSFAVVLEKKGDAPPLTATISGGAGTPGYFLFTTLARPINDCDTDCKNKWYYAEIRLSGDRNFRITCEAKYVQDGS